MARTEWKNRSWLRKFSWHRRRGRADCMPEPTFQEKLLFERKRAQRSNKPLVVMTLNAENFSDPLHPAHQGKVTESLTKAVNACIRESDICGLLKEDVLIGVILTEVEAEKVGNAQLVVAGKTKEKLEALLSHDIAERIRIAFHVFPAVNTNGFLNQTATPDLIGAAGETKEGS